MYDNCIFSGLETSNHNMNDGYGGAIYISTPSSTVSFNISDSLFENIYSRVIGGALYIDSGTNDV